MVFSWFNIWLHVGDCIIFGIIFGIGFIGMLLVPLIESKILLVVTFLLLFICFGVYGLKLDRKYLVWFSSIIRQKDLI